jgi:hypothetical protein
MRQSSASNSVITAGPAMRRGPALRKLFSLVLLLGVVTTALSGCIVVPWGGWGDGGHHHHGHYHDRY